jgi:hypothetical protein
MEGWSDSIVGIGNKAIHYFKDGVSLCGRKKVDRGHRHFDKSDRNLSDKYSGHCVLCIKKQRQLIEK